MTVEVVVAVVSVAVTGSGVAAAVAAAAVVVAAADSEVDWAVEFVAAAAGSTAGNMQPMLQRWLLLPLCLDHEDYVVATADMHFPIPVE